MHIAKPHIWLTTLMVSVLAVLLVGCPAADDDSMTPTPGITPELSPTPTASPTPSPPITPLPTDVPTATPGPSPSPTVTPEPTVAPTATLEPTVAPTATLEPTVAPTATLEPTVAPTATPDPTCAPDGDLDGITVCDGDCDDEDSSVYPGAVEICDGKDNACDSPGIPEEMHIFRDRDGDGFGTEFDFVCAPAPGYVPARGDCNDQDAQTHPGAEDPAGDGIDQDCGSTDGPEVHVGLSSSSAADIQTALDIAPLDTIVWVGPGRYLEHELRFGGRRTRLSSTHGAEETILDADGKGRVVVFDQGEGPETVMDGFTVTGGSGLDQGGGIAMIGSSPTLQDCVITGNAVYGEAYLASIDAVGGGIYLEDSSPLIQRCLITANYAWSEVVDWTYCSMCSSGGGCQVDVHFGLGYGGGLGMVRASPRLEQTTFSFNKALIGAGVQGVDSTLDLYDSLITGHETNQVTYTTRSCNGESSSTLAGKGGGLSLENSVTRLERVTLEGNLTDGGGGAGRLVGGEITLTETTVADNVAGSGGGLYLVDARLSASATDWRSSLARGDGGALYLRNSPARIQGSSFTANEATNEGGAICADSSALTLEEVWLTDNAVRGSSGKGGALSLLEGAHVISSCLFAANQVTSASGQGGGLFVSGASPTLTHCTLAGNAANQGGGVYLTNGSDLTVFQSILARNHGGELVRAEGDSSHANVSWSDVYNPLEVSHNLGELGTGVLEVDPKFVRFQDNLSAVDDDFHLGPASPARDAGATEERDADGSRADLGVYGGALGTGTYERDGDGDGLYDGWEAENGLEAGQDDSADDPDGDGLSNAAELVAGTDPQEMDSDGDGALDGTEVQATTDPADYLSNPAGVMAVRVPEQTESLEEALLLAPAGGMVDLAAGEYKVSPRPTREVTLLGRAGSSQTVISSAGGTAIAATGIRLTLKGLTIQGGAASHGGGIALSNAIATLEDVIVRKGVATTAGGGIYATDSQLTLHQVEILMNRAGQATCVYIEYGYECTLTNSLGGGLALIGSVASLTSSRLEDNTVLGGKGGGIYVGSGSRLTLSQTLVAANTASSYVNPMAGPTVWPGLGGGVYAAQGSLEAENCQFLDNVALQGGGLYLKDTTLNFDWAVVSGNAANSLDDYYDNTRPGQGGGLYLIGVSGELTQVIVSENQAYLAADDPPAITQGGGMYLSASSPTLSHVVFVGNEALVGGGLYLTGSTSAPVISDGILAYNASYNLYNEPSAPGVPVVAYSDLHAESGENHNLSSLPASNLTEAPAFLAYGESGRPADYHLAIGSPLIDQGDPKGADVDGSRADVGIFGGSEGGGWDLDGDGVPAWFWPGSLDDAPEGVDPADYDPDDGDPTVF